MKTINHNRKIRELSHHLKFYTKNTKQKFHLENIRIFRKLVRAALRITFLSALGYNNAQKVKLKKIDFSFSNLPENFDGTKFLFISDLHIDCVHSLPEIITKLISNLDYEFCILGGDYRFRVKGNPRIAYEKLKRLIPVLLKKSDVYAILGNHDHFEIAEFLDKSGVRMLLNENLKIEKNGESIFFVGVDDGHYYGAADFEEAEQGIPENQFKILLSHSPEFYREAVDRNYSLYLAGHTHGGQICLPGEIPVIYNAPILREMIKGKWRYKNLIGFTSKGAGSSMVAVRFFCNPEIVLVTLKRKEL